MSTAEILEKISALPESDRARVAHLLAVPSAVPRRVDREKLDRLAGCWSDEEAERIARFIEDGCEVTDAGSE
jgi:hypothetical protein